MNLFFLIFISIYLLSFCSSLSFLSSTFFGNFPSPHLPLSFLLSNPLNSFLFSHSSIFFPYPSPSLSPSLFYLPFLSKPPFFSPPASLSYSPLFPVLSPCPSLLFPHFLPPSKTGRRAQCCHNSTGKTKVLPQATFRHSQRDGLDGLGWSKTCLLYAGTSNLLSATVFSLLLSYSLSFLLSFSLYFSRFFVFVNVCMVEQDIIILNPRKFPLHGRDISVLQQFV